MGANSRPVWLDSKIIGLKVKEIRERKGLSQGGLADVLGMPQGQAEVSRWERGARRPGYEKMLQMAKLVGRGVEIFQVADEGALQGGEDLSNGRAGEEDEQLRSLADELAASAPSLDQLDWLPQLLGEVIRDRSLTAVEKIGLMGELNAAGMRYWAVAAEWSSGQRGIAMTAAEVSSGKRADASGKESESAGTRALTLSEATSPTGLSDEEIQRRVATARQQHGIAVEEARRSASGSQRAAG